jgi:hypothetical protein
MTLKNEIIRASDLTNVLQQQVSRLDGALLALAGHTPPEEVASDFDAKDTARPSLHADLAGANRNMAEAVSRLSDLISQLEEQVGTGKPPATPTKASPNMVRPFTGKTSALGDPQKSYIDMQNKVDQASDDALRSALGGAA